MSDDHPTTHAEWSARGKRLAESGRYAPKHDACATADSFGVAGADREIGTELPIKPEPPPLELVTDDDEPPPDVEPDTTEALTAHRLVWLRATREAKRRLDDEENPPPALPPVRSLDALLAQPPPPIRYRVDQLAPAGGRVILSAQWKAGKTTLVGNLIRALADDTPFFAGSPSTTPRAESCSSTTSYPKACYTCG
jgi:hypothetical protein